MKQFTALFLLFAFFASGVGQQQQQQTTKPQTQEAKSKTVSETQKTEAKTESKTPKTKPKTKSKTQKTKPKTAAKTQKPKITPKTQKANLKTSAKTKAKTKPAPKITIVEATTADGKAVTLKSNGTWEYTKAEPVAKITPKPTPEETPKPVAKTTPESKPDSKTALKLVVEPTPKPSSSTSSPVVKSTPVAATPTPVAKVKPTPLPTQCDLTLKDAPVIRGLKLGMTRNEADKIIPPDRVTMLDSTDIRAYPKPNAAGFGNVSQVTARFSEEKLNGLQIEYDTDAVKWKSAKEFADNLSANLNLPARFWKHNAKNPVLSEMQCREFLIKINSSLNEIEIEKLSAPPPKVEEVKETQKAAFKP